MSCNDAVGIQATVAFAHAEGTSIPSSKIIFESLQSNAEWIRIVVKQSNLRPGVSAVSINDIRSLAAKTFSDKLKRAEVAAHN